MKHLITLFLTMLPTASWAAGLSGNDSARAGMGLIFICLLAVFGLVFYFLPSIIARQRKHKNRTPVLLTNIFFGWTFIGWIVALIWAFTSDVEKT